MHQIVHRDDMIVDDNTTARPSASRTTDRDEFVEFDGNDDPFGTDTDTDTDKATHTRSSIMQILAPMVGQVEQEHEIYIHDDGDDGNIDSTATASNIDGGTASSLKRHCKMMASLLPCSGWAQLHVAPREYWILLLITLISSYSYFLVSLNLTTFLSSEFGFSDTSAGTLYGLYGLCSFFALSLGVLVDYMGVKRSMILAAIVRVIGVCAIVFATHWLMVLLAIAILLPIADSLTYPVYTICIKRYTTTAVRPMAYGIYYSVCSAARSSVQWRVHWLIRSWHWMACNCTILLWFTGNQCWCSWCRSHIIGGQDELPTSRCE
jgi:hypothetical protein